MSNFGEGLEQLFGSITQNTQPIPVDESADQADLTRFVTDLDIMLRDRLASATVIEVLSARNSKLLTREVEANGSEFVRRHYTSEGQSNVTMTNHHTYDLESAWNTMQDILKEAELPMVRSVLLEADYDSALIISDFVANAQPVIDAPVEIKKIFAERLAKCFISTQSGRLASPVLNEDGFVLTDSNGVKEIILVDIDPYLQHPVLSLGIPDYCIRRLCELFWDKWCTEDERQEVMQTLLHVINDSLTDEHFDEPDLVVAISDASLMANGIDPREWAD